MIARFAYQGASLGHSIPGCRMPHTEASHCRIDDPGGGVLLKLGAYGFLRLSCPISSRIGPILAGWLGVPGGHGHRVWCVRSVWPKGLQAAGGLFVGEPYGICTAGDCGSRQSSRYAQLRPCPGRRSAAVFNHGPLGSGYFFLVGVLYEQYAYPHLDVLGACSAGSRLWR